MKEMLRRGQDEIENDSRYLHNRMARRIAVRFIGTLFCYEIGLMLFFLYSGKTNNSVIVPKK